MSFAQIVSLLFGFVYINLDLCQPNSPLLGNYLYASKNKRLISS